MERPQGLAAQASWEFRLWTAEGAMEFFAEADPVGTPLTLAAPVRLKFWPSVLDVS